MPQLVIFLRVLLALTCLASIVACVPSSPPPPNNNNPRVKWEYPIPTQQPLSAIQDIQGKPYLYVAQKDGGLLILNISNPNRTPTIASNVSKSQLEQLDTMNLVQQGNFLFLSLGNFFAATGAKAGLAVIDVQNPQNPKILSIWTSSQILAGSSGVLIDGNFAYLAAMEEGIFIFDISNKNNLTFISSIQPDVNFPKPNPNSIEHPNARGIAIKNNLLFVANDAGGIRVIDVRNKNNPKEIAKYINAQMLNKAQAYNNIIINGNKAYVAVDYCGLEILDISNPNNIQHLGWWNPWTCNTNANLWFNSQGHTNQLHLDVNKKLVFLSAGDSEMQVVDVSNPNQPTLSSGFGAPKNKQGVWGISTTNDTVYLTYIKTIVPFTSEWSGIKAVRK